LNGSFKPTTKRFADLSGPDFFPTPRWATFALIENERFRGNIWECARGDGAMSRVLAETSQPIRSTDLYDRGYGTPGVDFLAAQSEADNIITNPPFNCAEGFVVSGLRQAKYKLALLLRLAFLEGGNRGKTIFTNSPPSRVWVFSERITFYQVALNQGQRYCGLCLVCLGQAGTCGSNRIEVAQARLQSPICSGSVIPSIELSPV
jgi:hypothetical protein